MKKTIHEPKLLNLFVFMLNWVTSSIFVCSFHSFPMIIFPSSKLHLRRSIKRKNLILKALPERNDENEYDKPSKKTRYVLGPEFGDDEEMGMYWSQVDSVKKTDTKSIEPSNQNREKIQNDSPNDKNKSLSNQEKVKRPAGRYDLGIGKNTPFEYIVETHNNSKKMVVQDSESKYLSRALWMYGENKDSSQSQIADIESSTGGTLEENRGSSERMNNLSHERSAESMLRYEDIDQSIPLSVFNPANDTDLIWDLLRSDALREAKREPLLVSFLYSSILNHHNLESALAFHLANRLANPSMISTQIMSLILESLNESPTFRKYLRADLIAVRDRDPACTCLPDVFLHFKGFHALQSQRVAHYLWKTGRTTLAHFFQSQMSQQFQIDIHPNATLGSGLLLDHGTGIVIGETATVGHNCSILHHVTLGGSGKRGVDRHPKVGNGVLLGAGASVLGNIILGDGCQVGAGTLVIGDLPAHSVAIGVPARIIGTYKNAEVPSQTMNQVGSKESDETITPFFTDGI
mmetsp:Transcript_6311/g.8002  ORF Transcript_6311/g.8002 Transcript_6311/m.8002 type:complete len:519 (-) Transcript_6311:23-1579(-)